MSFSVFTKLFDCLVQPIISYGAAVWGVRSFSCVNAVQNRAMRFFLGTNKINTLPRLPSSEIWVGNQFSLNNGRLLLAICIAAYGMEAVCIKPFLSGLWL